MAPQIGQFGGLLSRFFAVADFNDEVDTFDQFVDYAIAEGYDEDTAFAIADEIANSAAPQQQQQVEQSTPTWAVALIVLGSIILVSLVVVSVMIAMVMRRRSFSEL